MTAPHALSPSWPRLRPAERLLLGALFCSFVLVAACFGHAFFCAAHGPFDPLRASLSLVRTHHLSDLCISPQDDLRHPGWGRAEQGRLSQPLLTDPRPGALWVQPVPFEALR